MISKWDNIICPSMFFLCLQLEKYRKSDKNLNLVGMLLNFLFYLSLKFKGLDIIGKYVRERKVRMLWTKLHLWPRITFMDVKHI